MQALRAVVAQLAAGNMSVAASVPNPSLKRTRSGKPALAFISFWAKPVSPPRAA